MTIDTPFDIKEEEDNFTEWTPNTKWLATKDDMADTEGRFEGAVGPDDARIKVKIGQFLWVVPEGMTPMKSSEHEENGEDVNYLREVLEIGWHDDQREFLFACRGYIRADSTEDAGPFNDDKMTKSLKNCLGGKLEFIRTTTTDYIWESRIVRLVNVAPMDPSSRDFKTLDVGQPFFRTDLELTRERSGDGWFNWRATKRPHSFCTYKCKLGGIYVPHLDEMRWCENCRCWIHAACQERRMGGGPAFDSGRARLMCPDQNDRRWFFVILVRLARTPQRPDIRDASPPSHPAIPHTIETTLLHLKEVGVQFDRRGEQYPDFETYVVNHLTTVNLQPPDELLVKEIMDIIDRTPEQIWYDCAACGRRV